MAAEAAPAAPEPVIVPPTPESIGTATKIAALGSPAASVEGPASAKPKSAQSDKSKRLRAQRARERRRLAEQRARLAREAAAAQLLQQTQLDPFAQQPTITTATPSRKR
jgi:hypothetical protein